MMTNPTCHGIENTVDSKRIDDLTLEIDSAAGLCNDCEKTGHQNPPANSGNKSAVLDGIALGQCKPFDTIWISTYNSNYRLFLLDPKTGRVLIEGGHYFVEPVEAMISGSTAGNWLVNNGWIGIGMRVEVWFGNKFVITSPVRSIRVEAHSPSERELEAGSGSRLDGGLKVAI